MAADAMQSSRASGAAFDPLEISARSHPVRVVVAEDDNDFRSMLCGKLREAGYDVVEARDGGELGRVVNALLLRPTGQAVAEMVIADVRMPGASGLSVLSELRRSDWNTPVILMSAFADDDTVAEARRLGATVINKPFDLHELMWFVRQNTGSLR
jgi:DNA-binding response OmpR family regulator